MDPMGEVSPRDFHEVSFPSSFDDVLQSWHQLHSPLSPDPYSNNPSPTPQTPTPLTTPQDHQFEPILSPQPSTTSPQNFSSPNSVISLQNTSPLPILQPPIILQPPSLPPKIEIDEENSYKCQVELTLISKNEEKPHFQVKREGIELDGMKGELAHVVGRRNREILRPRMKVVCCATQSRTVLSEIKPRLIQVSGKDCNWVDLPCVDSEEGIYEIPFHVRNKARSFYLLAFKRKKELVKPSDIIIKITKGNDPKEILSTDTFNIPYLTFGRFNGRKPKPPTNSRKRQRTKMDEFYIGLNDWAMKEKTKWEGQRSPNYLDLERLHTYQKVLLGRILQVCEEQKKEEEQYLQNLETHRYQLPVFYSHYVGQYSSNTSERGALIENLSEKVLREIDEDETEASRLIAALQAELASRKLEAREEEAAMMFDSGCWSPPEESDSARQIAALEAELEAISREARENEDRLEKEKEKAAKKTMKEMEKTRTIIAESWSPPVENDSARQIAALEALQAEMQLLKGLREELTPLSQKISQPTTETPGSARKIAALEAEIEARKMEARKNEDFSTRKIAALKEEIEARKMEARKNEYLWIRKIATLEAQIEERKMEARENEDLWTRKIAALEAEIFSLQKELSGSARIIAALQAEIAQVQQIAELKVRIAARKLYLAQEKNNASSLPITQPPRLGEPENTSAKIASLRARIEEREAQLKKERVSFHVACSMGEEHIVKVMFKKSPKVIYDKNEHGKTGFHLACSLGQKNIVRLLVMKFPSVVDSEDWDGKTGFHLACSTGQQPIVELLLKDSLQKRDWAGMTGFHLACLRGQKNIVEFLLKQHPRLADYKDLSGRTGFVLACFAGHIDIIKLLSQKSKPNATSKKEGFCTACSEGHTHVVDFLLRKDGEEVNDADFEQIFKQLSLKEHKEQNKEGKKEKKEEKEEKYSKKLPSFITPEILEKIFEDACLKGNIDVVRLLNDTDLACINRLEVLEKGFDIAGKERHLDLVRFLFQAQKELLTGERNK